MLERLLAQAHVVEATSYLEFLKKERSEPFEASVLRGEVAAAILEYARAVGADLVALSARGEGGSSRFVFGSTAGRLAAAAECPVLVSPTRAGNVAGGAGVPATTDTLSNVADAVAVVE